MEVAIKNPRLTQKALNDFQLVERAKAGCQQAYAALMERHQTSIFHLMLRMTKDREDALDLTQEAFGKAFTRMASYVPNYAFSTWLYKIAVNNCIDYVRKKKLSTLSIDESMDADSTQDYSNILHAHGLNPEEAVIRDQRIDLMHQVLKCLNEKYRIMIELRYFQEYSYEEIASELDIPLGTVKAQLFRAKELLSDQLRRPGASAYLDTRMPHRAAV
ncbi:MAG: RNA polymerase subunit sigma-24 [Bacteroidetes bacterium]|nr:MAG: RNA polymerase subunit sigma-24 [Bacteroidota bacterium]PTM10918.1 MAG: RNA polymerase subunit sigma-24 [Bacteroidota bacterium]